MNPLNSSYMYENKRAAGGGVGQGANDPYRFGDGSYRRSHLVVTKDNRMHVSCKINNNKISLASLSLVHTSA